MNSKVNTIRILSAEAVESANSGHPGLPLGAATMAFTLWDRVMKHNPQNPNWINRDRFILSAGHGSALLYTLLHLYGYDVSLDDLKAFRQLGSNTPGHPEYGHTQGVETTTGPLGQGFANGVGMAMAERYLAHKFNQNNFNLIDHYTYVLVGDGCLMEGISYEAASLAGSQKLDKLIVLYDSNQISIEGSTDLAFTEDVKKRFEGMHWNVQEVSDGNDEDAIKSALYEARKSEGPSLIVVNTTIGFDAYEKAGSHEVHGSPLGQDIIDKMKAKYSMPSEKFHVSDEVRGHFEESRQRLKALNDDWNELYEAYKSEFPELSSKLESYLNGELVGLPLDELKSKEKNTATRSASGDAINMIAKLNENFLGGSADLGPSTKTFIKDEKSMFDTAPTGRNIHFGVREHAMGAVVNGMNIHGGLKVFGATFMVFSDYMKPAIRLASIMEIPTVFVFTHDSIGVGEDGPTHQPIEHLWMLRAIPNLTVHRPADYFETMIAWQLALTLKGPHAIVLSRQNLQPIPLSSQEALKGGYIVHHETGPLDGVVIATGSEVSIALDAANILKDEKIYIRVISMPSVEIFESQDEKYKEKILPKNIHTLAVEAGCKIGWYKYADEVIGMESYGASGKGEDLFEHFGFTKEAIVSYFKNK